LTKKVEADCNKWFVPHVIDFKDMKRLEYLALNPSSLKDEFRVKHLDREDIESLGFTMEDIKNKQIIDDYDKYVSGTERGYWILEHYTDETPNAIQLYSHESDNCYHGPILNKSRLKLVMEMLNIEKK